MPYFVRLASNPFRAFVKGRPVFFFVLPGRISDICRIRSTIRLYPSYFDRISKIDTHRGGKMDRSAIVRYLMAQGFSPSYLGFYYFRDCIYYKLATGAGTKQLVYCRSGRLQDKLEGCGALHPHADPELVYRHGEAAVENALQQAADRPGERPPAPGKRGTPLRPVGTQFYRIISNFIVSSRVLPLFSSFLR